MAFLRCRVTHLTTPRSAPVPKIDELAYVLDNRRPDLVFITETMKHG